MKKGQQKILSQPVSAQSKSPEDNRQRYVLYNCCVELVGNLTLILHTLCPNHAPVLSIFAAYCIGGVFIFFPIIKKKKKSDPKQVLFLVISRKA